MPDGGDVPTDAVGGRRGPLPLVGVRIVDLTHDWAGPHATRVLADFGAEVVKIEYLRRLDGMRGAFKEDRAYDRHPRWKEINRNKLSITLDLKTPKGLRAVLDLVRISDVVVESSRVGVMEKLGLGYDALKEAKPDIIMARMSPFGQDGPEARYAGYGGCLEPLSGVQVLTGYDEWSPPRRVREVDVTNGILGACAIMTALFHRRRTGRGQVIDLSQLETAAGGLIGEQLLEFAANGTAPSRIGNRHRQFAPRGCYRCSGDDRWLAIAVHNDDEWRRLCEVVQRPALAFDCRFADAASRVRNHDEIDRIIEAWSQGRSQYEAMHLLQRSGVRAGAVLDARDLCSDPHLAERGFVHTASDGTEHPFPGLPFRLSEGRGEIRRRGPDLGEHNEEVLCGLLGWSPEEVDPISPDDIGTAFDVD